jgi:hypothetical protein
VGLGWPADAPGSANCTHTAAPLPLIPSFYANHVLTVRNAKSVYRRLIRIRDNSGFDSSAVRVGIGIMTTPYTLSTTQGSAQTIARQLFPHMFKRHWPVGYPDRSQVAAIFTAFENRTIDNPLVVHIISGSEKEAYWTKSEYLYWERKDVPFWKSIRLLRKLGLRPHDVVRINLADNATWGHDIAEVRKQFPSQRLSLQIHRRDMNSYRENLSILAHKIVDVLPHIEEFQIDESLSAGQQGNLAAQARLYADVQTKAKESGIDLKPCVFSGGVGPGTVAPVFSQILPYCAFAGTDAVGKLQRSTRWASGVSPQKSAKTLKEYLELIADCRAGNKRYSLACAANIISR